MLDDREKDETENVSIEDLIEDSIEENERAEDSQTVAPAKPDRKDDSDDGYEKICYVCRRPESKAGPMITMPGGMNFCHDCMQKAFDTVTNSGLDLSKLQKSRRRNRYTKKKFIWTVSISAEAKQKTCQKRTKDPAIADPHAGNIHYNTNPGNCQH